MCSIDESMDSKQKRKCKAHAWTVLILNVISFTASLTYCVKFIQTDFESSTFAFMVAAGELGMIYISIAAYLMRHQIDEIFNGLWTIYDHSAFPKFFFFEVFCFGNVFIMFSFFNLDENETSFGHLIRANTTSEWMWTFFWKYVKVSLGGVAATSVLSVLCCYLTRGDFNTDHFYRPDKFVYALQSLILFSFCGIEY